MSKLSTLLVEAIESSPIASFMRRSEVVTLAEDMADFMGRDQDPLMPRWTARDLLTLTHLNPLNKDDDNA